MTSIYDQLDELHIQLRTYPLSQIEEYYYTRCCEVAGEDVGHTIKNLSLDEYEKQLKEGLQHSLTRIQSGEGCAIYFEYDMDNNWQSSFYLCTEYVPNEDEWACEWEDVLEGPSLSNFGEIIMHYGFDKNETSVAVTMYLIARTVCAFSDVVNSVKEAKRVPIAISYHDQDGIYHINHRETQNEDY